MDNLQGQIIRKEVEEKLKDFAKQVGEKMAEQQNLIGQVVKAFEALDARLNVLEKVPSKEDLTEISKDRPGKEL